MPAAVGFGAGSAGGGRNCFRFARLFGLCPRRVAGSLVAVLSIVSAIGRNVRAVLVAVNGRVTTGECARESPGAEMLVKCYFMSRITLRKTL